MVCQVSLCYLGNMYNTLISMLPLKKYMSNTKLPWRIRVSLNTLLWNNCVQHVYQPMHVQQPWNGRTEGIQPWAPDKRRSKLTSYSVWPQDGWEHLPQSAACNHVCITKSQIPPTMSKQPQCVRHLGISRQSNKSNIQVLNQAHRPQY
jgi:hypothetical protein